MTREELEHDLLKLRQERSLAQAQGEYEQVVLLELDIAVVRQQIEKLKQGGAVVARQAHNLKVAGANPAPASK